MSIEYGADARGGKWYYTNNKFGTKWFDNVNNNKGWTVDFSLMVVDVQNNDNILDKNTKARGIGVYVNDGAKQEEINFLTQEISFVNADKNIVYDTTGDIDYRLIGKKDNLKLFARASGDATYSNIANVNFTRKATNNGNGLKPAVFEDAGGNVHVAWHDDGNGAGNIYYARYSSGVWSDPELVVNNDHGNQFVDIIVDVDENVYLVYEAKEDDGSLIGLVFRNSIGWSKPYYTSVGDGYCKNPKLVFDSRSNVCVVWSDGRDIHPQIYLNSFSNEDVNWTGEVKLSNSEYGAYRPSISSYLDDVFISWTKKNTDGSSVIEIIKYNSATSLLGSSVQVSNIVNNSDYSDTLVNVSGKVFVAWSDNSPGDYNIYSKILSPSLATVDDEGLIVDGYGAARYPSLSEQTSTGDIYVTWQDYKSDYDRTTPITDPSGTPLTLTQEPLNSALYVAVYQDNSFSSSVNILFEDNRNTYFPDTPAFFGGELPILYESYSVNEYGFLSENGLLSQIKCAFYNLSRSESTYTPTYGSNNDGQNISTEVGLDRDVLLNKNASTKEIRFGDFSNVMNAHYIFKNFKYYTNDAVEPFSITEINSSTFPVGKMSSFDAVINNYGDVWMAGSCGVNFYVDRQSRVISVGEKGEIAGFVNISGDRVEDEEDLKKIKAIAFDKYNNMYIGGENGVRYAIDHINGFKIVPGDSSSLITSMIFDKENNLFIGTANGLRSYSVSYNDDGEPSLSEIIYEGAPVGVNITSLKVDDNNCVWIGSDNSGLYRFYKGVFFNFLVRDGLSSNIVNDIAIRNTAIRYIATSNGINKMIGFGFDADDIISDNDDIWNNNVKSILWKDPNLIIAGTLSRINQILVDDINEEYSTLIYEPSSSVISNDDFQVYYVIGENDIDIESNEILEVYINGTLVSYGYDIGFDKITDPSNPRRIIRFKVSLSHNDIVETVIRRDIAKLSEFSKTFAEKSDLGFSSIKIKDFVLDSTDISNPKLYTTTSGEEKGVNINDSTSLLPFDKIHLDTTPPTFTEVANAGINIGDQVDRGIVEINIIGATDGDSGSGIDTMIVSNNSDFVDDQGTALPSVPFSTPVNHSLGVTLEDITVPLLFTTGDGSKIVYFADVNELYASTSQPAIVYKYNWTTIAWEEVYSYGDDFFVDFITKYNEKLIISVGHSSNIARLYTYNYNISDNIVESIVFSDILNVSESRAFCNYELNGKLYVGTGVGPGEGSATGAGNNGVLYVYDGSGTMVEVVNGIDDNIYSLTNITGNDNLLAGTGNSGFIYEIDISGEAAFIIHNNNESIVSMAYLDLNTEGFVFAGGSSMGVIRRSSTNNNSYDVSFRTIPSSISALETFIETVDGVAINRLYAAVGSVIYYLSESRSWVWRYTHTENINDIAFDSNKNDLYVISNSNITKISELAEEKTVYLKLIDRAGNESEIDAALTVDENKFVDSIDIDTLMDFINENKIFELNEFGETIYTLKGDNKFYSANKIEQEKGEYLSEIFNGTNDLVKWDNLSWVATELYDTSVLMYVRTNSFNNDILTTDWIGPYTTSDSAGVDLSSFSGQYIQFKVELISTVKGVSPSFHRANIRAVTSEAIHFFTTNFVMPSRVQKGIVTSQKVVPVSADVVFGMNTTNSVDWADYQEVDENRLFNINQSGTNLRVGIKLISPSRSLVESTGFDEYGPYNSELFVNTVSFTMENNTSTTNDYHFRVSLYSDVNLTNEVFSAYSSDSSDGFNADGIAIPEDGVSIIANGTSDVLFSVPGSANITCNTYYYVKIEYIYDVDFIVLDDNNTFVSGCTASFIDNIDFDFINNESTANYYHFRVKFYSDLERTSEYLTEFSGNDRSGWFINDVQIPEAGALVESGETVNVVFRPDSDDFDVNKIYYLSIEAHDGSSYVFEDNSYTFQLRDVQSTESCGGYDDVPIVKNFGVMIELEDNEFVTLNI